MFNNGMGGMGMGWAEEWAEEWAAAAWAAADAAAAAWAAAVEWAAHSAARFIDTAAENALIAAACRSKVRAAAAKYSLICSLVR